ncbi:Peptidyl-tRNA hydrolase 2, mitochondrial [Sesamum angolense]|uniref:peptidyl-tRNA hydrolase n=1 Tax=Sesamum angolense TaxID=2727404 RepID=A0AAE1WWZ8_9LAMI|nr:Peptidyl-tRNA hydrolase 2, mitochondrial [Sesamum angolense]
MTSYFGRDFSVQLFNCLEDLSKKATGGFGPAMRMSNLILFSCCREILGWTKSLQKLDCSKVLVVRQDLKMGSGKIASQCAHAATGIYSELMYSHRSLLRQWELCGQPKIVVTCKNQQEMNKLKDAAECIGLPTFTVADAGRTQVLLVLKQFLQLDLSNLKASNQPSQNHHYEALQQTRLYCSINTLLIDPFLKAIASNGCPPVSITSPHCSLLGEAHFLSRCRHHGLQVFVSGGVMLAGSDIWFCALA